MRNVKPAWSSVGLTAMAFAAFIGVSSGIPVFADSEAQFGGASEAGGSVQSETMSTHAGESMGSHMSHQDAQISSSSDASRQSSSEATTEVGGRPIYQPSMTTSRGGTPPTNASPTRGARVAPVVQRTSSARGVANADNSSSSGTLAAKRKVTPHVPEMSLTSYHWARKHRQIAQSNRSYMTRTIQEAARTR
jgi:hypothetical protein